MTGRLLGDRAGPCARTRSPSYTPPHTVRMCFCTDSLVHAHNMGTRAHTHPQPALHASAYSHTHTHTHSSIPKHVCAHTLPHPHLSDTHAHSIVLTCSHPHACTIVFTYARMHSHTRTHNGANTCTLACSLTNTHKGAPMATSPLMPAYAFTQAHHSYPPPIHVYMHTFPLTHSHTNTDMHSCPGEADQWEVG